MKTPNIVVLCLTMSVIGTHAQSANNSTSLTGATSAIPAPTPYQVVEVGANHRVWQRETYEPGPNGQMFSRVHKYTELASGMYYQNAQGQWAESQELIEPYSSGAIARQGQYQVIFANNLNSAGAIDEQTPDKKRLRSNILGLAYYDSSTGTNVLIAQIQDSQGQLISSNQVLYPDAFTDVKADVRYTYKKGHFEQDVILREQPPTPESFGLNPATTEIEVLTEFINPPDANILEHNAVESGLPDQDINWGSVRFGHGKAFDLGEPANAHSKIMVRRQYVNLQGRHILIEGVPLSKILPRVANLPLQSSIKSKQSKMMASKTRIAPKTPLAQAAAMPIKFASLPPSDKGFVLDYVELSSGETNFTFQGDTTYFLSDYCSLYGTSTFEGGTVIKCNQNGYLNIDPAGTVVCQTAMYRPAVFTSMNDNTVGEPISGSSGSPNYNDVSLFLNFSASTILRNFRFCYAQYAIGSTPGNVDAWDCQFQNMWNAIYTYDGSVGLHNVLINEVAGDYPVYVYAGSFLAENVTCDGYINMMSVNNAYPGLYTVVLTNCLITDGAWATVDTGASNLMSRPIYQTVGAGSYYLAANSPFRNAGTANIDPELLADIQNKTTYPPIVYDSVTITNATTLNPQAQRDYLGNPDLGYHYDPLDYAFGNSSISSNLTFTAGTAVAWFYDSSGATYGMAIGDSATVSLNGTVTAPCRWVRYNTVQEGGNGNWTPMSYMAGAIGQSYTHAPSAMTARFTTCSVLATEAGSYGSGWGGTGLLVFTGNDSEFYGSGGGAFTASINVTNCLFVNGAPGLYDNYGMANLTMENCTCFRGNVEADNTSGGYWPVTIVNCAFDSTTFYMNSHGNPTNGYYSDYNSFLTNSLLSTNYTTRYFGGHEVFITSSYNWQTNWFGNYYLPTNSPLINAGSTTANQVGLYHFTTQTNQVPETNSVVDIGYHYVATDAYGNPLDTNGDGIPDYLEDANGNGLVDSGEIGWNIAGDLGLQIIISRPPNGTTLP